MRHLNLPGGFLRVSGPRAQRKTEHGMAFTGFIMNASLLLLAAGQAQQYIFEKEPC